MGSRARYARIAAHGAAGWAWLAVVAACAPRPTPDRTGPWSGACLLASRPSQPADTVTVALLDAVDVGHGPVARNRSEAFLFAHLFLPPIVRDCRGDLGRGFLAEWSASDGDRRWTLSWRGALRFPDGVPVTADTVRARWRAVADTLPGSLHVVDDTTLLLVSPDPVPHVPAWLADPAFAVPAAVPAVGRDARGRTTVDLPGPSRTLHFVVFDGVDPRDALDAGADVLVTGDRRALEYVERRSGLRAVPLPWRVRYVLVGAAWNDRLGDRRAELARDVSPVEARPAPDAGPECTVTGEPPRAPRAGRVLYRAGDPVARALAERLVALAPGTEAFASGVNGETLERTRRAGTGTDTALGYVLEEPAGAPCAPGARPLIEIRERVVGRSAVGPIWLGGNGLPILIGPER